MNLRTCGSIAKGEGIFLATTWGESGDCPYLEGRTFVRLEGDEVGTADLSGHCVDHAGSPLVATPCSGNTCKFKDVLLLERRQSEGAFIV